MQLILHSGLTLKTNTYVVDVLSREQLLVAFAFSAECIVVTRRKGNQTLPKFSLV